jgi:hypothetical protein
MRPQEWHAKTELKIEVLAKRRPEFETGLPAPKQRNLKKLCDAGGFKGSGCPMQPKGNFYKVLV